MNDMQLEAVLTIEGPLLVLAGAGSGKTTVLVNRIVNLVKYGNAYYSDRFSRPLRDGDEELLKAYLDGDPVKRTWQEARAMQDRGLNEWDDPEKYGIKF